MIYLRSFIICFLVGALTGSVTGSARTSEAMWDSLPKDPTDTLLIHPNPILQDLQRAVALEITPDGSLLILERGAHQIRQFRLASPTPGVLKNQSLSADEKDSTPSAASIAPSSPLVPGSTSLIGGYGFDAGAFADPISLSLTPGGRFLVGEVESARVQLFDSRWIALSSWSMEPSGTISNTRSTTRRIRPDAAYILTDGSLLVADLFSKQLHNFAPSGQLRSSHSIPDLIPVNQIRQVRFSDDQLWLLNGSNGDLYRLSPNGFYAGMLSCGFKAETFEILSNGVGCANRFEIRINQTPQPLTGHFSHEISEPLIDIRVFHDRVFLLTRRSLYHVNWNP